MGYANIKVFHAGMPAWKKAGNIVISEVDYIKDMMQKDASYVLVDVRPTAEAKKAHIPTAYTLPADKLALSKDKFPEDKSAPIILYTAEGVDESSFKTVRNWGYKNVTSLNGGLAAWNASGGQLASGKPPTEIVYVKKTPKGEVSIEEFEEVVKDQPKDKLILDVRDASAASQGMFKGAVNMPLDDLEARMSELPKDKEILIHCNTGIMAGMAQKKLAKAGYNARCLNAVVQVGNDGTYEITEK